MEIDIETIIRAVTKQVVQELQTRGVRVNYKPGSGNDLLALRTKSEVIDMTKYKTPVLTENHIRRLHELTGEVVIPKGTVITPKAREMVKEKKIRVKID